MCLLRGTNWIFKYGSGLSTYSSASVSTGNTFQDLPWFCETADITEHYV
jgi:hypothetical protein